MDRQGRGGPPHGHRRQSSLPPSLHRWIVPGPSPPRRNTTEEAARVSPAPTPDEGGDLWADPLDVAHPISSAPAGVRRLPSLVLTDFDRAGDSGEGAGGRQESRSPAPPRLAVSVSQGAAAPPASSTLSLPLPSARGSVVRSDPVYYASPPAYPHSYPVPPSGPALPPIRWPLEGRSSSQGGQDRRDRPPNFRDPPPSPRYTSPAPPPVAGPSRLQGQGEPRLQSAPKRRKKPPKSPSAAQPPHEAPVGSEPIDIPWGGSGQDTRDRASPSGAPPPSSSRGRAFRPLPLRPPSSAPAAAQTRTASPRRVPDGARRSPLAPPFSYYEPEYSVAVGSTAYDVTTLLPLRGATIMSPEAEASVSSAASPRSPEAGGSSAASLIGQTVPEAGPSRQTQTHPQGQSQSQTETESGGGAGTLGTKKRGKDKDSASSESSEMAPHPPKSKKISIACEPCRKRKMRCDGQRPICGSCRKRESDLIQCDYAPVARRRGPGKKERADSRGGGSRAKGKRGKGREGEATATGAPRTPTPTHAPAPASSSAPGGSGSGSGGSGLLGGSFPYARSGFEPQLSVPVPNYPAFAYRPRSRSSSSTAASRPFTFLSVRPGPSTRSSTSASDSVQSSTTTPSTAAPSIPDISELEEAYLDMTELDTYDEDLQHLNLHQDRPPSRDSAQ